MRKIAIVVLSLLATEAWADGTSRGYETGGSFGRFEPVVQQYNQSGELFRIVGLCQSACTIFLAIRNVCIERPAVLMFHAGRDRAGNISGQSTQRLLSYYTAALRDYLISNHYMDTFQYHAIPARTMIQRFGYRACPGR